MGVPRGDAAQPGKHWVAAGQLSFQEEASALILMKDRGRQGPDPGPPSGLVRSWGAEPCQP